MPRPPRPQFTGAVYHVYVHSAWGEVFFRRPSDRDILFWLLDGVVEKYSWECIAYCLMTTHVHLVIETPLPNIAAGMQRLLSQYAQGFNRRHGRRGHFVEARYGTNLVESDAELVGVVRYVELNPVAAGACVKPEDWLWSSYRATAGYVAAPRLLRADALLGLFHDDRALAQVEWRRLVEEAIARGEHLKPRDDRPKEPPVDDVPHVRSRV